ncbi:MAG: hypothetical protein JXR80_03960 [Deltaproteobacteria bacterium]|nr:hypothetical protein [Deltaproteobacteria bacterium]
MPKSLTEEVATTEQKKFELILGGLDRMFPSGLTPRTRLKETGFATPGSMANRDSAGDGVEGRLVFNGKTFYPNDKLAAWLAAR